MIFLFLLSMLFANTYQKSTEGDEIVRNKLFPKKQTFELSGPNFGTILNQSYIDTYLVGAGANYFWSETWGVGVNFMYALNQDRTERKCVETFYNNFSNRVPEPECSSLQPRGDLAAQDANYGPAYVPVRQFNYLLSVNGIWNPVYGKQIMFLSLTNYFDIFINVGGGLAFSTYYPLKTELKNGVKSRGSKSENPGTLDESMTGDSGRPEAEEQVTPMLDLAVGQKFHFFKSCHVKAEIRNYTLIGTPQGFDTYFALVGGFGVRF